MRTFLERILESSSCDCRSESINSYQENPNALRFSVSVTGLHRLADVTRILLEIRYFSDFPLTYVP